MKGKDRYKWVDEDDLINNYDAMRGFAGYVDKIIGEELKDIMGDLGVFISRKTDDSPLHLHVFTGAYSEFEGKHFPLEELLLETLQDNPQYLELLYDLLDKVKVESTKTSTQRFAEREASREGSS